METTESTAPVSITLRPAGPIVIEGPVVIRNNAGDLIEPPRAHGVKLIFERSKAGRRAAVVPRPDLPIPEVPEELRRKRPPRLPEPLATAT